MSRQAMRRQLPALRSTGRRSQPVTVPPERFQEDMMAVPALLKDTLELPVVGSPLFIVSGPELVIAQCKAGVVGSFPALNARPAEKFNEWLSRIEDKLAEYKSLNPSKKVAPYAVNQICHASNDRLMKDMETCVKHRVPIIIRSMRRTTLSIRTCSLACMGIILARRSRPPDLIRTIYRSRTSRK
jgi:NAD(P)H-dependent flavin oxidoreductase YrpB (nitropropane dioxygenase family)